jgi:glycerol uptake facilitator-like aquaporin
VSGGHLNPMVSLAVFFRRHLTAMQLVAYFFAQLLG